MRGREREREIEEEEEEEELPKYFKVWGAQWFNSVIFVKTAKNKYNFVLLNKLYIL